MAGSSFTLDPNKDEKTSSEAYIIRSDASELVLDVLGMGKVIFEFFKTLN